jgi:hypothetical protein
MDSFAMNVHGDAHSHIDALCHVIYDGTLHGGIPASTVTEDGAEALGIPPRVGSRRHKPSPGLDLSAHRESLALLLAELHEWYLVACDDYEALCDPNKPRRKLEENWRGDDSGPDYDYGEHTGAGLEDWDGYWTENFWRRVGNPGSNRTPYRGGSRPPIKPLRLMYPAMVQWWTRATGGGFNPEFAGGGSADEEAEPFERNNPAARFLILVSQELDPRFGPANARGLYDTARRQQRDRRQDGQ